jgi:hypothetical protein
MRTTLLLAILLTSGVSVVALAPVASASPVGCVPVVTFNTCCESSALGVAVCYDPYDLPCFVGATYNVGPVSGHTCVNWCRILGCPGPLVETRALGGWALLS